MHEPHGATSMIQKRNTFNPCRVDVFVVRSLIFFCNFKKFINQIKNLFVFKLTFNYIENASIPVGFIIFFSFFLVCSPFLIEDVSAFYCQPVPNYNHGIVLVRKEFSDKFAVVMPVIREVSSFEDMFESQHGFLKCLKSGFSTTPISNKEAHKKQQDCNEGANSEINIELRNQVGDVLPLVVALAFVFYWWWFDD